MRKVLIFLFLGLGIFHITFAQNRLNDLQEALALSTKRTYDNVLKQIENIVDTLDFTTAERECLETIEICQTLQYRRLALPKAYDILAKICQKHNRPDLALEYYLKSTENYEKEDFKQALAYTYYRIGFLHLNAKHFGKAQNFLQNALKIGKDSLASRQLINVYNALALCYKDANNFRIATKYFDNALQVAKKEQDSVLIAVIYGNIATFHFDKGEYQEALPYYKEALRINLAYQGDIEQIALTYNALGKTYLQIKQTNLAEKNFQQALQLALPNHIHLALQEAYHGLAQIYALKNDFGKAYQYHTLYKQASDSTNIKSKNLAVLEMQHRFDIEAKDNQILLLTKDIEKHYFQKVSFVAGAISLIILTFFFIRNYWKERKINHLLNEQNQQISHQKEEIQAQAEQLAQVNETKDKLFSIVSHDLRSPLNSLSSALELLQTQNISQVDFQRLVVDLQRNLDSVHNTLENLLQWAYNQMNGIKTQPQVFDIKQITEEIVALYQHKAEAKEISLSDLVRAKTLIIADKNQIRLIIRNLVANAIKFTATGGKVTLNAEIKEDWVICSVADTGVGMSQADAKKLFQSGTYFSKRGTANEKGTGLGLLLCKEFIEKNKGQIWLKSKENEGTTFYFSLPYAS
jgi:signal transduction histidine kinase